MISIQIGFYANSSQRPILKEIGLILNNKILDLQNRCNFSGYFGQTEASARQARKRSRAKGGVKNEKSYKKHLYPYAQQDRKTTKSIFRKVNS